MKNNIDEILSNLNKQLRDNMDLNINLTLSRSDHDIFEQYLTPTQRAYYSNVGYPLFYRGHRIWIMKS